MLPHALMKGVERVGCSQADPSHLVQQIVHLLPLASGVAGAQGRVVAAHLVRVRVRVRVTVRVRIRVRVTVTVRARVRIRVGLRVDVRRRRRVSPAHNPSPNP